MTNNSPVYYDGSNLVYNETGTPIIIPTSGSSSGFLSPEDYGAVGDGSTDDTTAWLNLTAAIQSAGGGHILCAPNKIYKVFNSGQALTSTPLAAGNCLCYFSGIYGLTIDMNGSVFNVGRIFQSAPATVTGAAAGTGGVVRLTVNSTAGIYTNEPITVASVLGTTEANGAQIATVVDATHIELQGITFVHAFISGGTVASNSNQLFLLGLSNPNLLRVKGWKFTQNTPTALPVTTSYGTWGVLAGVGGGDLLFEDLVSVGGQGAFFASGLSTDTMISSTARIAILNGSSTNCIYGIAFGDNGNDVFVRNFSTDGVERTYFAYGVGNHDISVTSRNAIANDVLISTGGDSTHSRPTHNINLNYHVIKRTTGSATSYLTFNLPTQNAIISNINVNMDFDYSGESSLLPAVQFSKGTTSSLGATLEKINIKGTIRGVPNLSGTLIDLFRSTDAPWSGETAKHISLDGIQVDGSATPSFRADLAAFSQVGSYILRDIIFPGAYSESNAGTNVAFYENVLFGSSSQPLTAAKLLGGTAVSSGLVLQSTSANGSSDFIQLKVGNNGAKTGLYIDTVGNAGVNTTTPGTLLSASGLTGRFLVQGTAGTPASVGVQSDTQAHTIFIHSGAGTDVKTLQFQTANGVSSLRSLNDALNAIGTTFITMNHTSGVSGFSKGNNVASTSAITPTSNLFHLTGTTSVTSITSTNVPAGAEITLIADGNVTITDGSNLKLAGNFAMTADDTLTLKYDGSNFYETGRSIN